MLCGHLGFAVGTHHCGGIAVESKMMIGHEHLDCGMGDMDKDCKRETDATPAFKKTPCCENQYLSLEIDNALKPRILGVSLNLDFVLAYSASFRELLPSTEKIFYYAHYDPPLRNLDLPVLHQVFTI
jgi:hypothetical protein